MQIWVAQCSAGVARRETEIQPKLPRQVPPMPYQGWSAHQPALTSPKKHPILSFCHPFQSPFWLPSANANSLSSPVDLVLFGQHASLHWPTWPMSHCEYALQHVRNTNRPAQGTCTGWGALHYALNVPQNVASFCNNLLKLLTKRSHPKDHGRGECILEGKKITTPHFSSCLASLIVLADQTLNVLL